VRSLAGAVFSVQARCIMPADSEEARPCGEAFPLESDSGEDYLPALPFYPPLMTIPYTIAVFGVLTLVSSVVQLLTRPSYRSSHDASA